MRDLDVEEAHVVRVLLDEGAAGFDVFAHERREHAVGGLGKLTEWTAQLS